MRKIIFILISLVLFGSLASAEIIINAQPNKVYNIGDSYSIPVTIKTSSSATNTFYMDLICDGQTINFYKNGIDLNAGEEKRIEASLIFKKSLIGEIKGNCVVKGIFGNEYILTEEFTLSDSLTLSLETEQAGAKPEEPVIIKGKAIKENGQGADGFIEMEISSEDELNSISRLETIQNGFFSINFSFPKDMEAKKYLLKLNAYEKEGEQKTNTGFLNSNIEVLQVPTNLEAIAEKEKVEPGTNARIRGVLHDQTGKNIASNLTIVVKDSKGNLREQAEIATDKIFEFTIAYNEPPLVWGIEAESNWLTDKTTFSIAEKKDVEISLLDDTLTITNTGNVFYNESVTVKIGEETVFIDVALKVDESQKYKLNAPDGEYEVTVLESGGQEVPYRSFLTGKAVSATETGADTRWLFSFAWVFIILVLLIVAYIFFRKIRKRTYLGHMPVFSEKKKQIIALDEIKESPSSLVPSSLMSRIRKAEVSMSIKGEKQNATTTCLQIKNLKEIKGAKGNAEETLQKLINFAEDNKALTYENQDNIYFILAPLKTKTFKNEKTALQIAQRIQKILAEHNRLFKQKMNFGISINNGSIIIKPEKESAKFMSLGPFIVNARKMAGISDSEILLSREVKDKLTSEVKAEKLASHDNIYFIKEFRTYNEEHKKFLDRFSKRMGSA